MTMGKCKIRCYTILVKKIGLITLVTKPLKTNDLWFYSTTTLCVKRPLEV